MLAYRLTKANSSFSLCWNILSTGLAIESYTIIPKWVLVLLKACPWERRPLKIHGQQCWMAFLRLRKNTYKIIDTLEWILEKEAGIIPWSYRKSMCVCVCVYIFWMKFWVTGPSLEGSSEHLVHYSAVSAAHRFGIVSSELAEHDCNSNHSQSVSSLWELYSFLL